MDVAFVIHPPLTQRPPWVLVDESVVVYARSPYVARWARMQLILRFVPEFLEHLLSEPAPCGRLVEATVVAVSLSHSDEITVQLQVVFGNHRHHRHTCKRYNAKKGDQRLRRPPFVSTQNNSIAVYHKSCSLLQDVSTMRINPGIRLDTHLP